MDHLVDIFHSRILSRSGAFLLGLVHGADGVVDPRPDHVGILAERPDVGVERLFERVSEVGIVLGHRRHLEGRVRDDCTG